MSGHDRIELAGVGLKARVLGLERLERVGRARSCVRGSIEDGGAVEVPESCCIGRPLQLVADIGQAAVRHLQRVEERQKRLVVQRLRRTVAGEATGRALVLHAVGARLSEMARELRGVQQVAQRRHRAQSLLLHVLAAQLHREAVRRCVGVVGIVAAGAGHEAGCRERPVEEDLPPERCGLAQRLWPGVAHPHRVAAVGVRQRRCAVRGPAFDRHAARDQRRALPPGRPGHDASRRPSIRG